MSSALDLSSTSVDLPEFSPKTLSAEQAAFYISRIKQQLIDRQAVLVAHYYTDPCIQKLATETGGCVSDSLEMARFGYQHPATTLVVAGVYFMGETAKILSPEKRIIMPELQATCSLDLGCPPADFEQFKAAHPDRQVVVYANTSAAVKAQADWVVTSSIAEEVVDYLHQQGHKILWAPDRYLGQYIQSKIEADMILWNGACIVHEEFKAEGIKQLKALYPEAIVLVHPESPREVIRMADTVGSTSQLIQAVKRRQADTDIFIVATDRGILYKMQEQAPGKSFLVAPTGGFGATCKSCAHCPWMQMNTLEALNKALESVSEDSHEIKLDAALIHQARKPLERMLAFKAR